MLGNGPLIGKPQRVANLITQNPRCPNCDADAIIAMIVGLVGTNSPMSIYAKQQVVHAAPQEGHALCLNCLRRERWEPGSDNKDWDRVVIFEGLKLEAVDDGNAIRPSP